MEQLLESSLMRLELPSEVLHTEAAQMAGLKATTLVMFPAVFTLVALLQRVGRKFGVLFRSFGEDHKKIEMEWNAFCEMKHPVFSHLLEGMGPLDGSVPGLPDRRIRQLHTLYRDSSGPLLILDSFTNGPPGLQSWDMWAKQKPKAKEDSRGGRSFIQAQLQSECVDGVANIAAWMRSHVLAQKTAAIKDDWAWWFWNGQHADAGKLLTVMPPKEGAGGVKQLFFDDNVEHDDARIIDCRTESGDVISLKQAQRELLVKINPVEVLNDEDLFLKMLQRSHGDHCNQGFSFAFQRFCQLMRWEGPHGDIRGAQLHQDLHVPKDCKGRVAQDVFHDPNCLSWLFGYMQLRSRGQLREHGPTAIGAEGMMITKLLGVAIQAMLDRPLRELQLTDGNGQKLVILCHGVLERMAMAMQLQRRHSIRVSEVAGLLPVELHTGWDFLLSSTAAPGAHLLKRTSGAAEGELIFFVQAIQSFFAAQSIDSLHAVVEGLPGLETLLTDPWWAQTLYMLAEGWPACYVSLVQDRLSALTTENGESFLHMAAAAGHVPVFQLLERFAPEHRQMLASQTNDMRWTPLHVAAKNGNTFLCSNMLERKSGLCSTDVHQCWPMHVALQNGHFHTAKFLSDKWLVQRESEGECALQVCDMEVFDNKAIKIMSLEGRNFISESEFVEMVNDSFPELCYFQAESAEMRRTLGALLAVYWIVSDQYNQFVRSQAKERSLSKASWQELQQWVQRAVRIVSSPRQVWIMLVFVAIMSMGKIKGLRMDFSPECEEFNKALIKMLQTVPHVIPSFARLDSNSQQMIMSCLIASDFNFGQFLQAESLPANLVVVKSISLGQDSVLGFFLFRIFAAMCGICGKTSLEGSLFMNEQMFRNFKMGLDVLDHLQHESPEQVYCRFLSERTKSQGLTFNPESMQSRVLARLACMCRAFDQDAGSEVSSAFDSLEATERELLTTFLDADGISVKPAFLLYNAPNLLDGGRKNQQIGLQRAMRMLLKIYKKAAQEYKNTSSAVVTVIVDEIAAFAMKCCDPEMFVATEFDIARSAGATGISQAVVFLKS